MTIDTLASDLEVPWAIEEAPDGRLFIAERPGRIRVLRDGRLEPWAEVPALAGGEAGLMGLALAPDFSESGRVYVMVTIPRNRSAVGNVWGRVVQRVRGTPDLQESHILVFTERAGEVGEPEVVVRDLPAGYLHAGGRLRFGPDGMLYATVGDATRSGSVRDDDGLTGTILRYRPDGAVPEDAPGGSPVYARGFRNVQGLAWAPGSGALFATDHGPTGLPWESGRFGHDELNVVAAGADYGWPIVAGAGGAPEFRDPITVWSTAAAPADARFHPGPGPWANDLLVTGLRARALLRLSLAQVGDDWTVGCTARILDGTHGRLRALAVMQDGGILVATSNRDGRGVPGAEDDLLLRLDVR